MRVQPIERWLRHGFRLCLAIVGLYLVISAFEPFRTNWGDPTSDGNAMTSGRYFARDGFVKTAFTPILDVGPLDPDSLRYIHYPPLPDLVAGVVQKLIGPDHLPVHRLLAILWSAIALGFLYRYLRALWGEGIAALGVVLIATNLLFLEYADTIHHIPLYLMTGFGCLCAAVRWLDHRDRAALGWVAAATFFCFLASYDFYFFLSIMILATVWLRKARVLRGHGLALVLVFGCSALASIAVKNLLVIWAVGLDAWHRDVVFQFFERATSTHSRNYKPMLGDIVFWRLWRFNSPLLFAAIVVQLVGVTDVLRGRKPLLSLQPLILLGAALPFMFVFSQLVAEQYHPMVLLLPFAAVVIAQLVQAMWATARPVAVAMMALYLGWQLWAFSVFKKTFLHTADIAAVRKVIETDRHPFVLSNIFIDGPVRYVWDRHLFGLVTDVPGLRELFESYGSTSPLTLVQLRRLRPHMFDKGLFAYFGGDRQLPWIARPDYYRPSWGRRFDELDQQANDALAGLGQIVYESREMIVRSVTLADLDRVQASRLPAVTPSVLDFGTEDVNAFKVQGISGGQPSTTQVPGFAWLYARTPAKLVFTLQGYDNRPLGPPNHISTLQLPLPADRDLHVTLEVSSPVPVQHLSIQLNGHVLATPTVISKELGDRRGGAPKVTPGVTVERLEVDVPKALLHPDRPQRLEIEFSNLTHRALRLHRILITPGTVRQPG